jgi:predicted glycogen debranching enzyme
MALMYTIETGGQLQPGLSQEWLLTNGTGAFSSSTVVGCNTRRYHGLLCAATLPPVGRIVALSRVGELLKLDGSETTHELAINQFASNFHPRGERYLRSFKLGDFAQWDFEVERVRITKQVQLLSGRNVVGIRYIIDPVGAKIVAMQLIPFIALRDFHALRRGTDASFNVHSEENCVSIRQDKYTLHVTCDHGSWNSASDWWRGHHYAIDADRGQDHIEDLFQAGRFTFEITKPTTITLWASTDPIDSFDWDAELTKGSARGTGFQPVRAAEHGSQTHTSDTLSKLTRAANDFIVARKNPDGSIGSTVIAGYPWFADWGRDTMISLPGLFLSTGRFEQARDVLTLFGSYVSQGMIPNKFDDYTSEPSYNTADASLWFVHACFEYLRASSDHDTFERKLLPACQAIVQGYSQGTRYGIRMDPSDGLITQGDATTQLTWMDAKCNNVAFTPRQGKAVEINALWYNALKLLKQDELAARVRQSFAKAFWISPFRGLCDVVNESQKDQKIRPNQIFAVSLPYSALSDEQQHAVVEVVRRELLTPYGLRTLAPSDPQFHSKYSGDQFHRDGAYHNGTIWPWLIGAFLEAYLKVNKHSDAAKAQARTWLHPLIAAMHTHGCIGQISEIYEAAPPHRPVGCCAQAWSIAEVLRIAGMLHM